MKKVSCTFFDDLAFALLSNSSCTNFELQEFSIFQKMCISRPYCITNGLIRGGVKRHLCCGHPEQWLEGFLQFRVALGLWRKNPNILICQSYRYAYWQWQDIVQWCFMQIICFSELKNLILHTSTGGPPLTRKSLRGFPLPRFLVYVRVSWGFSL